MIVPGSASQSLSAALATELGEPLAPVEFDRFPDGELMGRVPGFEGGRVVVVASTVSSDAHVELLQLQDAVLEQADEVVTVVPYMGYARQDQRFREGEPISARAVAKAVSTGTDRVLTVNPHETGICDFFTVPCEAVDAAGRLATPLPEDLVDPLFLSPDAGAIDLAESVRDAYGVGEVDYFEKTRLSSTEVELTPSDAAVENRDAVLVDDIIATGSTMSEAVRHLHADGVRAVHVTTVHPMLATSAQTKLARAGVEAIHGTDTIERAVSDVSAAPAIADYL